MPVQTQQGGGGKPDKPERKAPPATPSPAPVLAERSAAFREQTITSSPGLVTDLIFSDIPRAKLHRLDEVVRLAQSWMEEQDAFAGVPGFFTPARVSATALSPQERADVEQVIQQMRERLPPDAASLAAAYLRAHGLSSGSLAGLKALLEEHGIQAEESTLERIGSTVGSAVGAAWDWVVDRAVEGWRNLTAPAGTQPGVASTFAQLQGLSREDVSDPIRALVAEREREQLSAPEQAALALGAPFEATGRAVSEQVRKLPGGTTVADVTGTVIRGATRAIQVAGREAIAVATTPFAVMAVAAGAGRRPGESAFEQFKRYYWSPDEHAPTTHLLFDIAGMQIDDPANRSLVSALDLGIDLIGPELVARTAAGIRTGRTVPREMLGAAVEEGTIRRAVAETVAKSWDEWLAGRRGRRWMDEVVRTTDEAVRRGEDPVAWLTQRMDLDPRLARALAGGTAKERAAAFLDAVRSVPDRGVIADTLARINAIDHQLAQQPTTRGLAMMLRAEKMRLERSLTIQLASAATQFEFPRYRIVRAVLRGAAATRAERIMARISSGLHLERLVDELPEHPRLWSPWNPDRPADWAKRNVETVQRYLQRAGAEPAAIRQAIAELNRIGDRQAWKEWLTGRFQQTVIDAVTRKGTRSLPRRWLDKVGTLWRNTDEEVRRSPLAREVTVDGETRTLVGNVLEDADGRPLPSTTAELAGDVILPSVKDLVEVTSVIRRASARLGPLDAARYIRAVFDTITPAAKSSILGPRVVAMTLRIQPEQFLRTLFSGEGIPIRLPLQIPLPGIVAKAGRAIIPESLRVAASDWWFRLQTRRGFRPVEVTPADVGALWEEAFTSGAKEGVEVITLTAERSGRRMLQGELADKVFEGVRQQLESWSAAPEVRYLALHGPEKTLAWAEKHGGTNWAGLKRLAEEHGVSPEELLRRLDQAIDQMTGGNPDLRRAIAKRRFARSAEDPQVAGWTDELDLIERTLREMPRTPETEIMRRELLRRRAELRVKVAEQRASSVSLSDRGFAKIIAEEYEQGRYQLPAQVQLRRRMSRFGEAQGFFGHAKAAFDAWTHAWYSLLRFASRADLALSRGGLFERVYRRVFEHLKSLGWDADYADAWARARAGAITRDLMYDLSARTSFQRALRDVFYFAPAWQEAIWTWLVKIPSSYYWPLGIGYLANRLDLLLDFAKDAGFIRKDARGEDVIVVPIGGFLSKVGSLVVPGDVKVPDVVFGRPEGLNMVTSGGFGPGLSPPAAIGLSELSRRHGGVFRALSEVFQPFGEDVRVGPAAFNYAWSLVTGDPAPWEFYSKDALERTNRRVLDLALAAALSDMFAEGQMPPRFEDFPTGRMSERTGRPIYDEDAYRKALDAYFDEVERRAHEYYGGMMFTKLVGSTVTPMSLDVTDEEREAWLRFFGSLNPPEDATPEERSAWYARNREQINRWLDDHPDSFPYSVSYYATGEKERDLAWEPVTQDEEFYAKLYTGELKVLSPEDWLLKFQAAESHRHYISRLNAALQRVGRTPAQLLRNWAAYRNLTVRYREDWAHYLHLNPEVKGALEEARRAWATSVGIPVGTFENERIAETVQLLEEAKFLFTDGMAGDSVGDWRAVLSSLKALYREDSDFGPPRTKRERMLDWYFSKVIDPYMSKVQPLLEKARQLSAEGLTDQASRLYERVRRIKESFEVPIGPDGERYPTPEQFFWGALTPEEQSKVRMAWATRPLSWLTSFQLKQAGYDFGVPLRDVQALLDDVRQLDQAYYEAIDKLGAAPGSRERDRLDAQRADLLRRLAGRYGPWAKQVIELEDAAPIFRLAAATKYGMVNQHWADMVEAVRWITDRIRAEGLDPAFYSQVALRWKVPLVNAIERFRDPDSPDYDRTFDELWLDLQEALFSGDNLKDGVPMYEAVLFGQFNEKAFGMDELIKRTTGG